MCIIGSPQFTTLCILLYTRSQPSATPQKDFSYIDQEIAQLKSSTDVRKYWGNITLNDQKYRVEESSIVQQYGHDSKEYKEIWEKINKTDQENLVKVEKLLAKFGYPRGDSLGSAAASAPFWVIHHAPTYETKEKYFPYLYDSYQRGDLKEGPFSFYLNRMYKLKMGKRYEVGAVFSEQDRINGIIEELGLLK